VPWCAVTLPDNAMGDIPTAGEYVVNAIRTVAARSGRSVNILGFSQGGMVPRWALRFWPDTRALVDQYVALDPSNHGTLDAYPVCAVGCAPAFWQQQTGSHFTTALNSGVETFAGISYTVIYSDVDEVVVPNLPVASSSSLTTGNGTIANISVQSICPTDVSDHLAMGSYDPVGYALAIDSFTRNAVAKPGDVPLTVCATLLQPGVDPTAFPGNYAMYLAYIGNTIATTPFVSAEPTLPPYVYAAQ
jgi:triacylglycerol esterase/lipase EstA (alpha/beta hydrolase family)